MQAVHGSQSSSSTSHVSGNLSSHRQAANSRAEVQTLQCQAADWQQRTVSMQVHNANLQWQVADLQGRNHDLEAQCSLAQLNADTAAAERIQLQEALAEQAARALADQGRRRVPVLGPVSSCAPPSVIPHMLCTKCFHWCCISLVLHSDCFHWCPLPPTCEADARPSWA